MNEKYLGKYRSKTLRTECHEYNGGEYFITICTKNREHYLGEIDNGEMQSNYYEHRILNHNEMNHIAEYIENNVANWQK